MLDSIWKDKSNNRETLRKEMPGSKSSEEMKLQHLPREKKSTQREAENLGKAFALQLTNDR